MLPKAEGCCTGLQLSAKEVVLGRPDMITLFPNHLFSFLPPFLPFVLCWGVRLMINAALSFPTGKRKRLRPLAFSLLLYSYLKKRAMYFSLKTDQYGYLTYRRSGAGKKTQFFPLPFLGGQKWVGDPKKYISRETGTNTGLKISTLNIIFSSGIFFPSQWRREAAEGSRVSRLKRRGDGKEGGRGRGGSEMRRETLRLRQRQGSGSGKDPAGWRWGPGELEGGGVASQSESGGGGGSSPHCARSSCRRRLDPAAMAAAAAEAAPFRPQAAAPRLLPIRRGHGNPATASVPRGPLPRPRHQRGRPPAPRFCTVPLRKCPRFAPSPEPCQRLRGRLLLVSFLPSFVTRPGRRRRRQQQQQQQHEPAFARVGGCSLWGVPSAQPPSSYPLPLPPPTRPPPPSSRTQPYTAQRPAARVRGVWESPAEQGVRPLRQGSRSPSGTNHGCRLFADPPGKSRSTWRANQKVSLEIHAQGRKMPKIADRGKGGFALFCGWLEEKFGSDQSESLALRKSLKS